MPTPNTRSADLRPPPPRPRGFTLVEVLGVLTIVTILFLALAPVLIRQHDLRARGAELATLKLLAQGLEDHVRNQRSVPASGTMPDAISARTGWHLSAIQTTPRGFPRFFLVDPACRLGDPLAPLPFVQGPSGSLPPSHARILIVSSLSHTLSTNLTLSAATDTNRFDELWASVEGQPPTGWNTTDRWEDVLLRRVNLDPLFIPVILNNHSAQLGHYSVDDTNTHAALPANPFSTRFLAGTVLGLHRHDGVLQARMVLQDNPGITNAAPTFPAQSFVYERDVWRGKLFLTADGQRHNGLDLESAYQVFMGGTPNTYNVGSVSQTSLTLRMYQFMSNYVAWAEGGFAEDERDAVEDAQASLAGELTTYCNKKATTGP